MQVKVKRMKVESMKVKRKKVERSIAVLVLRLRCIILMTANLLEF